MRRRDPWSLRWLSSRNDTLDDLTEPVGAVQAAPDARRFDQLDEDHGECRVKQPPGLVGPQPNHRECSIGLVLRTCCQCPAGTCRKRAGVAILDATGVAFSYFAPCRQGSDRRPHRHQLGFRRCRSDEDRSWPFRPISKVQNVSCLVHPTFVAAWLSGSDLPDGCPETKGCHRRSQARVRL